MTWSDGTDTEKIHSLGEIYYSIHLHESLTQQLNNIMVSSDIFLFGRP